MTDAHATVREFVNRNLDTDGAEQTPLSEVWNEYRGRYPNSVPRELFRWHLEQAGVETEATVDGVTVYGSVSLVGLDA